MLQLTNIKELFINGVVMKELYANGKRIWSAGRIPSEYQEVEYIKAASGIGAYLNLGFAFDTAARIKIGAYLGSIFTDTAYQFGAAESSGKYRCMFTAPNDNGAYGYVYGSNGSSYIGVRISLAANSVNDLDYVVKAGEVSCTNNTNGSVFKQTGNVAFTMTSNLLLFAQNYNGSARWGGARQIHYFKYYDKTDTLICDLVPCYRIADGVIGMYDIVRNIFLTNVGSRTFTKGANV